MSIETNQICPWVPAELNHNINTPKRRRFKMFNNKQEQAYDLYGWNESHPSRNRLSLGVESVSNRYRHFHLLPHSETQTQKGSKLWFKSKSFGCGGRWWIAYLHSCHSMRVSNLLNTEDLTVGEIKGENLEARGESFIREEGEYLEVVLATAPLLQWSFRFLNPVETALEFVREKIAVVADIFCWFVVVFSVWFMF